MPHSSTRSFDEVASYRRELFAHSDVERFFRERLFETDWRLVPLKANGRLGFACYSDLRLAAINVLTVRDGRIAQIDAFLDPQLHRHLGTFDGSDDRVISYAAT